MGKLVLVFDGGPSHDGARFVEAEDAEAERWAEACDIAASAADVPALLAYIERLRVNGADAEAERDHLAREVDRQRARAEAAEERVKTLVSGTRALDAELGRLRPIADDLRDLVREVDRPKGGMGVTWMHDLASAARLPSVVRWARWHLRQIDGGDDDRPADG